MSKTDPRSSRTVSLRHLFLISKYFGAREKMVNQTLSRQHWLHCSELLQQPPCKRLTVSPHSAYIEAGPMHSARSSLISFFRSLVSRTIGEVTNRRAMSCVLSPSWYSNANELMLSFAWLYCYAVITIIGHVTQRGGKRIGPYSFWRKNAISRI